VEGSSGDGKFFYVCLQGPKNSENLSQESRTLTCNFPNTAKHELASIFCAEGTDQEASHYGTVSSLCYFIAAPRGYIHIGQACTY
jgi:flavin reductase (DIM6/NTAB) family NADH-FMN oxidoreductase RutF